MQYSNSVVFADSQPDRLDSNKCYDLAIIGAGISSAYTLIHYVSLLEQQCEPNNQLAPFNSDERPQQPVKILVTEKSGEFWTGIPYGSRSGRNSLLISSLKEFIPQQLEREHFIDWLDRHRESIFAPAVEQQGELASKWLAANETAMSEGRWDDLFIPRSVFGLYLKQRLAALLAAASRQGLIEIDLVTVDVLDIQHVDDIYRIDGENANHFWATKLVLAIGSPPNVAFESRHSQELNPDICYIDNMYEPSLDANIERICKSLEQSDRSSGRKVLIIGSNASTLDVIYSIQNSPRANDAIDKFIILSPNGAFPHRIAREVVRVDYIPEHLLALVASSSFTANQILAAVAQDVASATAKNINISDIYTDISKLVIQASTLLSFEEQKLFVFKYAVEIGKLQRRAGGEYLDVVDDLVAQTKLAFIKGRFVGFFPVAGGASCEYINSEARSPTVLDTPIAAIVNCAGFQDVTKSSSPLIQNLIERKICTPNDSNRGFVIDKNFEASKNCYVMGPLVAGNIDGTFRVWHAESCQRIISLSQQLAAVLLRSALEPSIPLAAPELEPVGVLVNAA